MRRTRLLMGMPISVDIVDADKQSIIESVFQLFKDIDGRFSTYKKSSEITAVNNGLPESRWSDDMKEIFRLSEQTRLETDGYFNIRQGDRTDPSGIVKGWAIQKAASFLNANGAENYYIDAGGDVQTKGKNRSGQPWIVGIRNPFNRDEIIKKLTAKDMGIATSGTYVRGEHIYNPKSNGPARGGIVSFTIIAPNIMDADRFATAAFAMGPDGIYFIEAMSGLEGYMVDDQGKATLTSGFHNYVTA